MARRMHEQLMLNPQLWREHVETSHFARVHSLAFAAPGYCFEHWQAGRATMTVLGFRAVEEDTTAMKDGAPYARWEKASSTRAAKAFAGVRREELRMHVADPEEAAA